jgi:hypothetical protein
VRLKPFSLISRSIQFHFTPLLSRQTASEGDFAKIAADLQRIDQRRSESQSRKDTYRGAIQSDEKRCHDIGLELRNDKYS